MNESGVFCLFFCLYLVCSVIVKEGLCWFGKEVVSRYLLSGPVLSGVLGQAKFRYDEYGLLPLSFSYTSNCIVILKHIEEAILKNYRYTILYEGLIFPYEKRLCWILLHFQGFKAKNATFNKHHKSHQTMLWTSVEVQDLKFPFCVL